LPPAKAKIKSSRQASFTDPLLAFLQILHFFSDCNLDFNSRANMLCSYLKTQNSGLRMSNRILFLVLLLVQPFLRLSGGENLLNNPGFEELTDKGHPSGWGLSGEPGPRSLDETVAHSGRYSLKISPSGSTHSGCLQRFGDISGLQDDYILRGWVKYQQLSQEVTGLRQDAVPFIGIWTSVAGGGNSVNFNAFNFPPGDSDWQYFEKVFRLKDIQARIRSLKPEKSPKTWAFAIRIRCQPGTIWFDDLEFCRLTKPDRLEATLSSRAYATDDIQAIATVQAIRATGTAEDAPEIKIQVKAALRHSSDESAVISIQEITVTAAPVQISFPLHHLREGEYCLRLEDEGGNFQACELKFTIVNDPFGE